MTEKLWYSHHVLQWFKILPLKHKYVRKSSVFGLTGNNLTGEALNFGLEGVSEGVEG